MPYNLVRKNEAQTFEKHGINLTVYNEGLSTVNLVWVSVKEGHFQEFIDKNSDYTYLIHSGYGTFVIDDKPIEVSAGDMLVVKKGSRIHYFGKLEMVLAVSPAFNPDNEVHVRYVKQDENPYS